MKKTILFRLLYLCSFLILTAFNNAATNKLSTDALVNNTSVNDEFVNTNSSMGSVLYQELKLSNKGLTQEAFSAAVKGYERLKAQGVLQNPQYLSIVDLSQSSRRKRFYLIDMENHELAIHSFVAHGKNSGVDLARSFSNAPNSEKSSLGFYITKNTYRGKHGVSLKLAGLENGFNDNAEARGIVVHAADYVNEGRVNSAYMGRSQGCPALPNNIAPKVIKMIKEGSALFVYNSSENYLHNSSILNS
jgi:hypothetical protein